MTDQEINKALALAIGYSPDEIRLDGDDICVYRQIEFDYHFWRTLDYRKPDVIWPIAEKYDAFPVRAKTDWYARCWSSKEDRPVERADNAAKAVALAIINMKGTK